jgi:hypothetical protein
MAQMAMPGSALDALGLGRATTQKPVAGSPAENFMAFLESVPGRMPQNPARDSTPPFQGQATTATPPHHPVARGTGKGDRSAEDPAPNLIPTAPAMQTGFSQANVAPVSAILSPASEGAEKSCEIIRESLPSKAQTTAFIDPSPPAAALVANACLNEQVAVQVAGKAKSAPGPGNPGASNNIQDVPPLNPPVPLEIPAPVQLVATAPLPVASPPEQQDVRDAAVTDISPSDNLAIQLFSTTPNPEAKQSSALDAAPPPLSTATASAVTAMSEANRAVALRVSHAIRSGQETLTIELHPAELGHVAVHLAFHGDSVDVRMVVGRQETFQAFSQDRAALEQQFSQAGIDLGTGGLDLRYSQTPAPEPRQASASGPPREGGEPSERESRAVILGDNLVNIVA